MKAVILSAGQGKRLMPLTADNPKCLLNIEGQSLIEWQIDELYKGGIEQVTVVVGYHADRVRGQLQSRYGSKRVRVLYNPTFAWADNLFSCWVARSEMNKEFILINGDTIFECAVVDRLLAMPARPITVVTHRKRNYDADDMKVALDGDRLVKIGKDLAVDSIDGESIGMMLFRREGALMFRRAVEDALRDPAARKKWYLAVINEMAQLIPIWTCPSNELRWCEVDFPADLKQAGRVAKACRAAEGKDVFQPTRYAWG
ncbi:CTP:Inositol-1-phosphate cytidylyltransferase [Olavius algarvensis Delta 1 endosymbiont]|nr:CTP:Inositol-1-phosphate cytidylyltransferase [Olavius algarvensis Delta 1 endosymbiont]